MISATLDIRGLGLYRAHLNGQRIGEHYLIPGFNDYDAYLRYQSYDVTKLLKTDNCLEVTLGDGRYKGRFGLDNHTEYFGQNYLFWAVLTLKMTDGIPQKSYPQTNAGRQCLLTFSKTASMMAIRPHTRFVASP